MRIILEGPDGAGKTTLAERMAKKLGLPVMHLTGIKDEKLLTKQFNIALNSEDVILDRYIFSNLAYHAVFGGTLATQDSRAAIVQDLMSENNFYPIIFCLPCYNNGGVERYKKLFAEIAARRHEDYPDVEKMGEIWKYMSAMYDFMSLARDAYVFDYTDQNADAFIDNIQQYYNI